MYAGASPREGARSERVLARSSDRRRTPRPAPVAQTCTSHTVDTVRKIILQLSMSLDGYFEGPGRELDWHQVDDELHRHFNEVLAPMSVFIDGRVNYELMAQYWPHADEDPNASAH